MYYGWQCVVEILSLAPIRQSSTNVDAAWIVVGQCLSGTLVSSIISENRPFVKKNKIIWFGNYNVHVPNPPKPCASFYN